MVPGGTYSLFKYVRECPGGPILAIPTLPTGELLRNGAPSGVFATVSLAPDGAAQFEYTIPSTWDFGDELDLRANWPAAVNGTDVPATYKLGPLLDPKSPWRVNLDECLDPGTMGEAMSFMSGQSFGSRTIDDMHVYAGAGDPAPLGCVLSFRRRLFTPANYPADPNAACNNPDDADNEYRRIAYNITYSGSGPNDGIICVTAEIEL